MYIRFCRVLKIILVGLEILQEIMHFAGIASGKKGSGGYEFFPENNKQDYDWFAF